MQSDSAVLQQCPEFAGLSSDLLERLSSQLRSFPVSQGDVLRQDASARGSLYILFHGEVEVVCGKRAFQVSGPVVLGSFGLAPLGRNMRSLEVRSLCDLRVVESEVLADLLEAAEPLRAERLPLAPRSRTEPSRAPRTSSLEMMPRACSMGGLRGRRPAKFQELRLGATQALGEDPAGGLPRVSGSFSPW